MNLQISDFRKNNIIKNKDYICKNHGGNNILPKISWNKVSNALSYALIMEDIDANYIHLNIPYIRNDIEMIDEIDTYNINKLNTSNIYLNNNQLKKIKLFFGKNHTNKFGYFGPCAPDGTGIHRYIYTIYALNGTLPINDDTIDILNSKQFLDILESKNIKILDKDSFMLQYKYL